MIERCGRRCSAIGMLRTRVISRSSMNLPRGCRADYPQSGERIHGPPQHSGEPDGSAKQKRFTVRRIIGSGDLWVTEFVLTYDGIPSYTVSIMEFRDGLVANETAIFRRSVRPRPLARASCRASRRNHVMLNAPRGLRRAD